VDWKTYEALLQELGDDRSTRIADDRGVLEIRVPGEPHKIINRLLAKIITMLTMELGMEANDFGLVAHLGKLAPRSSTGCGYCEFFCQ
jgi:Uma2 family endonuclease